MTDKKSTVIEALRNAFGQVTEQHSKSMAKRVIEQEILPQTLTAITEMIEGCIQDNYYINREDKDDLEKYLKIGYDTALKILRRNLIIKGFPLKGGE